MRIELRPLSTITPYPGNPRKNDPAVDAVVASLKAYGFRQPIVVDPTDDVGRLCQIANDGGAAPDAVNKALLRKKIIGGLALACFVKVFGVAFLGEPRTLQAAGVDHDAAP